MKEIMNGWRKFALLKETTSSEYSLDVNLIRRYIGNDHTVDPEKKQELIDAARRIISNNNQQHWKKAGQLGTANELKATAPDSVWNVAVELAGKNAEAGATEPVGTKLQRLGRENLKINIPFLDPSTTPEERPCKPGEMLSTAEKCPPNGKYTPSGYLNPWWRKQGARMLIAGGLLQTLTDTFLDAESVALLILSFFTGGLAMAAGRYKAIAPGITKAFNYIHKIIELKSATHNSRGLSAFQEVEQACRRTLNNIVSSPYANKLVFDPSQKVVKYEALIKPMAENAGSNSVSTFVHWIQSEVVPGFVREIEAIMVKYPIESLAIVSTGPI